jgi:hypothetical protein
VAARTEVELAQLVADLIEEETDFVTDGDPDAEIDIRQAYGASTVGELGLSEHEMAELEEDGYVYLEG